MTLNTRNEELKKRLIRFVIDIIKLFKKLPNTLENQIIFKQLIRSASSIGANYAEAVYAHTRVEFIHCMNICRKEAHETLYWLELLAEANINQKEEIKICAEEARSILKIFIASVKTAKSNN